MLWVRTPDLNSQKQGSIPLRATDLKIKNTKAFKLNVWRLFVFYNILIYSIIGSSKNFRVSKHKDLHVSHSSELCSQSSRYEGFSAFEVINPIVVIFEAVATKSYPTDF